MSFKKIIAAINGSKGIGVEEIAKQVFTPKKEKEKYPYIVAEEWAFAKLENSKGVSLIPTYEGFPLTIQNTKEIYGIVIEPERLPDKNKMELVKYAQKLKGKMPEEYSGVIIFTPFSMNNRRAMEILRKELNVEFINLPYDKRGLERRIQLYNK